MKCFLYYGDKDADPPTPARVVIPLVNILDGDPTHRAFRFMMANVKNPST